MLDLFIFYFNQFLLKNFLDKQKLKLDNCHIFFIKYILFFFKIDIRLFFLISNCLLNEKIKKLNNKLSFKIDKNSFENNFRFFQSSFHFLQYTNFFYFFHDLLVIILIYIYDILSFTRFYIDFIYFI